MSINRLLVLFVLGLSEPFGLLMPMRLLRAFEPAPAIDRIILQQQKKKKKSRRGHLRKKKKNTLCVSRQKERMRRCMVFAHMYIFQRKSVSIAACATMQRSECVGQHQQTREEVAQGEGRRAINQTPSPSAAVSENNRLHSSSRWTAVSTSAEVSRDSTA
jgi:hypothetical protein